MRIFLKKINEKFYQKLTGSTQNRRGWINKYPCLKTGGVAEESWHYHRVLPSFKRRHTKFQIDSYESFDLTAICIKRVWCFFRYNEKITI